MPKIYQCGFSGFVYELFEDPDGRVRATKTSVKTGRVCLEKQFDSVDEGKDWIVSRNALDQKFILACQRLIG